MKFKHAYRHSRFHVFMIIFLVRFYGIATLVGYLMPNPVYTYILIYTPGQKYKAMLRNEEKGIVYNF